MNEATYGVKKLYLQVKDHEERVNVLIDEAGASSPVLYG